MVQRYDAVRISVFRGRQRKLKSENVIGIETTVRFEQGEKRPGQQSSRNNQHEGQRDFQNKKPLSNSSAARTADRPLPSLFEGFNQVRPTGPNKRR